MPPTPTPPLRPGPAFLITPSTDVLPPPPSLTLHLPPYEPDSPLASLLSAKKKNHSSEQSMRELQEETSLGAPGCVLRCRSPASPEAAPSILPPRWASCCLLSAPPPATPLMGSVPIQPPAPVCCLKHLAWGLYSAQMFTSKPSSLLLSPFLP